MKKLQSVIYFASGENSGTYSPKCFAENFTGDLNEKTEKFINWDFDMYTTVDMYKVVEVEMPEWMDESQYLNYYIELKYAVGLAGECVYEMSFEQFYKFKGLGEKMKFWYGWSQKSKNPFIVSLRDQFNAWLNGENNFSAPLSHNQWEAGTKYCPLWEAKRISNGLYHNRSL